jgi:hypothetical protein
MPASLQHEHLRKRSLERPRGGWNNGVKIDLEGIKLEDMDWIHLLRDRNLHKILETS